MNSAWKENFAISLSWLKM
ncbi:hypothetical protein LEMLEM_LOCUS16878 [Lemmus lemmus]